MDLKLLLRASAPVALILAAGASAMSARAQTSPAAAGPTPSAAPTMQTPVSAQGPAAGSAVEEIVVTAQKRSENLQDVPISVTAVSASSAKAAGVLSTADLNIVTPGLSVTQTTTAPLFFLRGVGTAVTTVGDEGSVSVVVDGVPYTSLPGSLFSLNSIDRIEVLRGPQGTLFGRNADGGVINIITRDPKQTPSADVSVGYGDYNAATASVYATTGLAPGVAIDGAVQWNHQADGFGTNLYNGEPVGYTRDLSLRSKLLLNPDPTTTIRLSADYYHSTGDEGIQRHIIGGSVGTFGTLEPANFQNVDENVQPSANVENYGGSLRIEQKLPFAQINTITAYRQTSSYYAFDQDSETAPLVNAYFNQVEHQLTQEIQIASLPSSRIKWVAGTFYLSSLAAGDPITLSGLAFDPLGGFQSRYGTINTRSIAGFGQVTVPITDRLNVTGGLRYTSDQKAFNYFDESPVTGVTPTINQGKTFSKLTYRASVDYKLARDLLVYASASSGFKSGLFNVINPANPPILPETLYAYEAGVKSELFDRKLRLNASGFYYDYKDIQVGEIVSGQTLFLNASKATIYGADFDFEARPVSYFSLNGGLELLHSSYGNFPDAPDSLPNPFTPGAGATVANPCGVNPTEAPGPRTGGNTICTENAEGHQLVRAPDAQLSLSPRFTVPSRFGEFGLSVTYAYSASFPWEPDNRLQQKATNIFNGQISWQPDRTYDVRLWVRNLTNQQYYSQESSSLGDSGQPAEPRTFGATLDAHF